ncbi:MAG: JAB domain-containing protein [Sphingomicrobium sp.]
MDPDSSDSPQRDDAQFEELQLQLPLSVQSSRGFGRWDGEREWPSTRRLLDDYLERLGVADHSQVAVTLLRDFGSISGLLSASWWRLCGSAGHRLAGIISATRDIMKAALAEDVARGPVLSSRPEVLKLIQTHLGSLNRERLIAIYVDAKQHLLRIEPISEGSLASTPMEVGRILHRALDVGAAGILLVHNHPSGDPTPSISDIQATARLRRISADLDIHLIDHLVVAGGQIKTVGLG